MGGFKPGCGEHQGSCEPVWPLAGKILSEGVEDAEDLWSKISKLSEQGSRMKEDCRAIVGRSTILFVLHTVIKPSWKKTASLQKA